MIFKAENRILASIAMLFLLAAAAATGSFAQTFTPGNIVVAVEGCGVQGGTCAGVPNGTGTGTGNSSNTGYGDNQATPLTLFQFTPSGTYVNSVVLPQTASGANQIVSAEYGSQSEGTLQLDGTGRYLTIMGYGVNANLFNANATGAYGNVAGSPGLAQSGSVQGQGYTPVPRVVALIDSYGNVNSSTAIYNVFNMNNPRSIYTLDGTTNAYISGQGNKDTTGGVFLVPLGTTTVAPTAITGKDTTSKTLNQDTRDVQIYNGGLYVSVDSTEGSGSNRSYVGSLGTPPATSLYNSGGGPTQWTASNNAATPVALTVTGKVVITASETNGINTVGSTINISPENYFFASPSVLYVADSGSPKQTSAGTGVNALGAGGLQKWVNSKSDGTGTWVFVYSLYQGLNLVPNTATTGASGLLGLAGSVSGNTVTLYATPYNVSDLDPSYLYSITDSLSATTSAGQSFTKIATAPSDSNFRGVAFAPSLPAGSATVTTSPSGIGVTVAGTGCAGGTYTTPFTQIWTPGSNCTLTVTSPQTVNGTQYVFGQWQDGTTSTTDSAVAPTTSAIFTGTFIAAPAPIGNLELAVDSATGSNTVLVSDSLFVSGWTADLIDGSPLSNIQVYVDGTAIGAPTTSIARNDVATYYNKTAYKNSGYQLSYAVSSLSTGSHVVTVVATDSGGRSTTFGPLNFTVSAGPPVGNLERAADNITGTATVSQSDSVVVSGWVADPTDGSPLTNVKVLIDGTSIGAPTLGLSRTDVATYFNKPGYASSGFQLTYPATNLSAAAHSVTVTATDSGSRTTTLGPLTITVTTAPVASAPFGSLELAVDATTAQTTVSRSDSLFVSGWVADTIDGAPLANVKVYIDGALQGAATTGIYRQDVASYFNSQRYKNSGYQFVMPASTLTTGTHNVTVIAIDTGARSTTFGPLAITVQ